IFELKAQPVLTTTIEPANSCTQSNPNSQQLLQQDSLATFELKAQPVLTTTIEPANSCTQSNPNSQQHDSIAPIHEESGTTPARRILRNGVVILSGSFHQANMPNANYPGVQCTAMAIAAIIFEAI